LVINGLSKKLIILGDQFANSGLELFGKKGSALLMEKVLSEKEILLYFG
jgi:hypothetical protein